MPKPEIDDVFNFYPPGEAIDEALEAYGEACYADGKADALPPWPPDGEFSKEGKGRYKFMNGEWWVFMTTMWGAFQNCRGSNEMTAAYFRGELEEVK